MAILIAMYHKPADPAAFDRYYFETHVPIAKRLPGLRRYQITRGPIMRLEGASPYHLIATLSFDTVAAIQAAIASPEGKATATDLANFAQAGAELFIAESDVI